MAFKAFLMAIFIVVAVAPALATDYVVGDNAGWTLGVNYTAWVEGKDFRVGDTLIFIYKPGSHNVLTVNGDDFRKCTSSNVTAVPRIRGSDVIPLTSPGKKWYICDISDHCSRGMKLVITVSVAEGPDPSPMPGNSDTPPGTSSAVEVCPLRSSVWMLAMMVVYRMIMA